MAEDAVRQEIARLEAKRIEALTSGDVKVRVYGGIVIVNGPLNQRVSVNGIDKINEISAVVTQGWVLDEDGWKQSSCHMDFLSIA